MLATLHHQPVQNWLNGHMNGMATVGDVETAHWPHNMEPYLPRSVLLLLAPNVQSPATENNVVSPILHHSSVLTAFGSLLYWKGHNFFLIRIDSYSENGFAFPLVRTSVNITRAFRMHNLQAWNPTQDSNYQEIYFREKDVCRWAHEHGILWYHTLHHSKAVSLLECQNFLLQVQIKYMFRGNTLQIWHTILQDVVYALNLRPPCGTMSPIGRMHVSRGWGVEVRVTLLSIFPSDLIRGRHCASHLNSVLWKDTGLGS